MREIYSGIQERTAQKMNGVIIPYYKGLAVREQRVLLFALAIVLLIILIFTILLPLHDRHAALKAEVAILHTQFQEASLLADRLEKADSSGTKQLGAVPRSSNALADIESVARISKVRQYMTRIHPQPSLGVQRLLVQFRDVPYSDAIQFLDQLGKKRLGLDRVKMQASEDSGKIMIEIVVVGS